MTRQQFWMFGGVVVVAAILIHLLGAVMTPFVVSAVLAYLGDPLVDRLERLGLSRTLSVTLVFLVLLFTIAVVLLLLVPLLLQQFKTLVQMLPVWEEWFRSKLIPWLVTYVDVDPDWFDLSEWVRSVVGQWQPTRGSISNIGRSVTTSGLVIIGFVVNLFLVPVVTFYLLRDWDRMVGHLRRMLPVNLQPVVVGLTRECDEVLGAFLKGQLMVMLSLGLIYGIGLWIVGLQFALLVGLMAGLVSIIPYMGFFVGILAAAVIAFFQFDGYFHLLMVIGVFAVGQALEGWVLTPWLVGDRIGLHPVAVIFALMAGSQLMGLVGMLVALPLAAIVMVLLRHLHGNYKASQLYNARELK